MSRDYDDKDREKFRARRDDDRRISRRRDDGGRRSRRDDDDDWDDDDDYRRRDRYRDYDDFEPHRGTLILVLGILGLVMSCIFLGIPAWIMGSSDLKAIADGRMDPEGEGMTRAGYILGIVATVISGLTSLWLLLWIGLAIAMAARH